METFQTNVSLGNLDSECQNFEIPKFNQDIQAKNSNYQKEREEFFQQIFQDQYDRFLINKDYKSIQCLMYELLNNIVRTEQISNNFKNENTDIQIQINKGLVLRETRKSEIDNLIDKALIRKTNSENEKESLKSVSNKFKTYTSITAFIILFQIFLIFFV